MWANEDEYANSSIFPQTMTKMQVSNQSRNPQKLKLADCKKEVNSINSIISREVNQVVEPVSVSTFILIEPSWDCFYTSREIRDHE